MQASGEAQYAADSALEAGCLHAAYVASTEALASIKGIDARKALSHPGVVAYISADDVPGKNKIGSGDAEEIFATSKVCWYHDLDFAWIVVASFCPL